jgi:hypothetical protein
MIIYGHAQTKNFELNNPNAILLDEENLEILTSGYWRVYQDDLESRGSITSTPKNISICYYPDGTFFFNGSTGTWKILDERYIEHKFNDKETEKRLNFGEIYSLTKLDNSLMVLTKLLASSNDLKRTLYLKSSTILTKTEQSNSGGPYFYDESLSQIAIDSISKMNSDELFNAGFTPIGKNTVHIFTPDSLYVIELQSN